MVFSGKDLQALASWRRPAPARADGQTSLPLQTLPGDHPGQGSPVASGIRRRRTRVAWAILKINGCMLWPPFEATELATYRRNEPIAGEPLEISEVRDGRLDGTGIGMPIGAQQPGLRRAGRAP